MPLGTVQPPWCGPPRQWWMPAPWRCRLLEQQVKPPLPQWLNLSAPWVGAGPPKPPLSSLPLCESCRQWTLSRTKLGGWQEGPRPPGPVPRLQCLRAPCPRCRAGAVLLVDVAWV